MKAISLLRERSAVNTVIFIIPLVIISRAFPLFTFVYYLLPVLFLLVFIQGYEFVFKDRNLRSLLLLFLVFGLWCGITSFWSDYPLVTLSRAAYFVFISFGAVLAGYSWSKANPNSLALSLPANVVIIILSLFSLITNIPADSWTGGHGKGFMGFSGHQNTLASAILFTLPGLMWQNGKRQPVSPRRAEAGMANGRGLRGISNLKSQISNLSIWFLLLMDILILILSYSRGSILSLVCGVVFFLFITKRWKILIYSFSLVLLFVCLVFISPALKKETVKLIEKDFPAFYSSREWLWVPSYKAALNGGLTGLGYGMSDPEIKADVPGSHYEGDRYIREKGNSVLALIEETGIVGLVLFIVPLIYLFYKHLSRNHRPETQNQHPASEIKNPSSIIRQPSSILIASLAAFIVHSLFEAWWVGVGSTELPLFFLYIGCVIKPIITNDNATEGSVV
ncbi:MAG TPA: O-antigen ligase family protein [Candidatus Brocadiaceae bacterium]